MKKTSVFLKMKRTTSSIKDSQKKMNLIPKDHNDDINSTDFYNSFEQNDIVDKNVIHNVIVDNDINQPFLINQDIQDIQDINDGFINQDIINQDIIDDDNQDIIIQNDKINKDIDINYIMFSYSLEDLIFDFICDDPKDDLSLFEEKDQRKFTYFDLINRIKAAFILDSNFHYIYKTNYHNLLLNPKQNPYLIKKTNGFPPGPLSKISNRYIKLSRLDFTDLYSESLKDLILIKTKHSSVYRTFIAIINKVIHDSPPQIIGDFKEIIRKKQSI